MLTYWPYFLNVFLMLIMPIALGWFIARKREISWRFFGMGAATFVLAQVFHIPFNWLVLGRFELLSTDFSDIINLLIYAAFLGLSAALFEEGARYLTYRYWATDARTWGKGLMLGAGHGGIESMLLGILVALTYTQLAAIQGGAFLDQIPAEQMPLVEAQIEAVFGAPWYMVLLGGVERLFAICFHLSASLLVMMSFIRGQARWLVFAIIWHALLDGVAVVMAVKVSPYLTEAAIGVMAVISLVIVFWLRSPEPVEPELEPLPEVGSAQVEKMEITSEMLDRSRYL